MLSFLSIVVIEDNPVDQDLLKEFFHYSEIRDLKTSYCTRLQEGIDLLSEVSADLVLLDLSLPDSTGCDGIIRLHTAYPELPVIILTGLSDSEGAIEYIQHGAQDYLIKGEFDEVLLFKSIKYAIERQKLVLERNRVEERLLKSVIVTQEEERARFSRELHDGVVQLLTALSLNLNVHKKQLRKSGFDDNRFVHRCEELLQRAITDTRSISHNLMPVELERFGLVASIEGLCQRLSETKAVDCRLLAENVPAELAPVVQTAVYRVVQEFVENSLKHGNATEVEIVLKGAPACTQLLLEISDDGCGFDVKTVAQTSRGIGLRNITQRFRSIHAKYELKSVLGVGTTLYSVIPVNSVQEQIHSIPTTQ